MERVLNAQPGDQKVSARRVLEINENHPIYQKLLSIKDNEEQLKLYTSLLYGQALLIEGMSVEDPVAFSNDLCKLLAE